MALIDGKAEVAFCRFDGLSGTFEPVPVGTLQALASQMRGGGEDGGTARMMADREGRSWRSRIAPLLLRLTKRTPSARPHLLRAASHARRAMSELGHSMSAARSEAARHGTKPFRCASAGWGPSTLYCSLGMDWLYNDLTYLAARRAGRGFRVALMVHDLLPEVKPQYSGKKMSWHFEQMLLTADVVVVNSDATAADLGVFARACGVGSPAVVKLPMASALRDLVPVRPVVEGVELVEGGFVLCVGTVTIRKNHQLLFDVWERLLVDRGREAVPMLVVVGTRGWLSEETMSRLGRTPEFRGVVVHLADASDECVAWLYEQCAFTVYPSLYEGWGLPVSESLDFGKVCLTTDRSSLPEAGEGLVELLDGVDRGVWADRVWEFWVDVGRRREGEELIRERHRRVTASDAANTILQLR